MTIRKFCSSGQKGKFAQQLVKTYDDPCPGNFRLLWAVADGQNRPLVDDAVAHARNYPIDVRPTMLRDGLEISFPMLAELDREMTGDDYRRLPREAASKDA